MRYAALITVFVAGCAPSLPPPVTPDPGEGVGLSDNGLIERTPDTCGLPDFQPLVGQPADSVNTVVSDQPVRIITPGSIVTNEYNPQRVNVDVDGNNVITNVRCG
ncbi:MAG: I78 family peptidase inhibitor [Pseudomonadota bacterium]